MSILTGITVIELCEVYQGPLAGQSLGDFGARVIKVERPPKEIRCAASSTPWNAT